MVKTISVRDEVYRKLISIKRTDESFSELLERLMPVENSRQNSLEVLTRLRGSIEFTEEEKRSLLSELRR